MIPNRDALNEAMEIAYEVMAMIWAMNEYIHSDRFAEWVRTGGTK